MCAFRVRTVVFILEVLHWTPSSRARLMIDRPIFFPACSLLAPAIYSCAPWLLSIFVPSFVFFGNVMRRLLGEWDGVRFETLLVTYCGCVYTRDRELSRLYTVYYYCNRSLHV